MIRSFVLRRTGWLLLLAAGLTLVQPAAAQSTTGAVRGRITSGADQPLAGAQVLARNTTTGFQRGTLTDVQGRYLIPQLPPGGPYTVSVTSIGFAPNERTGLTVSVGDATNVNFDLSVQAVQVAGIIVTAEAPRVDATQAGVVSRVGSQQVENLPVAGRDFTDFLNLSPRVSPQPGAGTGGQFAISGQRTSGTNVQIDGTDANNIYFGENRGSTRTPFAFSLESIREFALVTNGYDVEYGNYQGGVVNAVTRGGTNDLQGSFFYFRRDEALTGKDFTGVDPRDYEVNQFGANVSGPILRDRLHFFASADLQRKAQPIFSLVPGLSSTVTQDSVARFLNALRTRYGVPNPEQYFGTHEQEEDNNVLFGRLDWTMNDRHRLTLRQNYSNFIQTNDRINPNEAVTNGGPFKDKAYSTVAELNSVLGGNAFNVLRFQFSYEDRPRPPSPMAGWLPQISVTNVGGGNGVFGGDGVVFRNRLEENKLQLIDNFTYRTGRHGFKVGGNVLIGGNANTFWGGGNGSYTFTSLTNFENGVINQYSRSLRACLAPLVANAVGELVVCPDYDVPIGEFDYTEYAVYAQDEVEVTDALRVTAGLRYQGTSFPDDPQRQQIVADTFGFRNDFLPAFTGISPRLSFSYDFGRGEGVLRGGAALLVGRAPTVLAGNAVQTERPLLQISCAGTAAAPTLNPATISEMLGSTDGQRNPASCRTGAAPSGRPEFTIFAEDFELPKTLKTSIGYERLLATDTKIGIDFVYSRATDQFTVKDLNLGARSCQPTQTAGAFRNRDYENIASCFTLANEGSRPVFVPRAGFNPRAVFAGATANSRNTVNTFDRVYYNVSDGEAEAYDVTISVDQRIGSRLNFSANYGWVHAYDNSSFSCCTSNEGFGTETTASNPNRIGDFGDEDLGWGISRFERRHTFASNFLWRAPYGILLSGIWRSQSGLPYTPTVDGDINGDGQSFNDRAQVGGVQLNTAADTDKLNTLLSRHSCLQEQQGQIAARNSCRGPWFHSLNMRLSKEINTVRGQRVEILADVFNVLNGLNSDWGKWMDVFTASTNLYRAERFDQATGNVVYSVNYTAPSGTTPESGFGVARPTGFEPYQFQVQLGARYRF
jgi:hypothetical protein